jgi:ribosomal-protein-alanine N-acetyltransferase
VRPLLLSDYSAWHKAQILQTKKQTRWDLDPLAKSKISRAAYRKRLKRYRELCGKNIIVFGVFKKNGEFIGSCELAAIVRMNIQTAKIAYRVLNIHWGHGYGFEAARALTFFSFKKMKLHRLEAEVQRSNFKSIKLLRKLKYRFECVRRKAIYIDGTWRDFDIYSLVAEDYKIRVRPTW